MYQRGRIQPFLVNVPKDGHVTPTDFSARINLSFSLAVHRDRIRSIAFPSTMTVVRNHDEHDYMRMTNLRKLVFSPNLKAIESGAFAGCFLLEELVIPESVTDIGRGAFAGAGKALKVVIVKGWRRHPAFSRRYGNIFTSASLRAGIASEVEVKVEVVDAPNSFVRMLGGVCKGYSKYKGLPAEIRGRSHQYPFISFHSANQQICDGCAAGRRTSRGSSTRSVGQQRCHYGGWPSCSRCRRRFSRAPCSRCRRW